jgi:hypothetical protein
MRTLIGIEDVRLAVTRQCISVAVQNAASIAIDDRHDSTRRLAHASWLIEQQDYVCLASPWWRSHQKENAERSAQQ